MARSISLFAIRLFFPVFALLWISPIASGATPFYHEAVDTGPVIRPSLVIGEGGEPHVSYYRESSGHLRYAVFREGAWDVDGVDFFEVGLYNSLALDAENRPHVCYYDSLRGDLLYANKVTAGQFWYQTVVDSVGDVGRHCSLAMDALGNPHITYYDAIAGDLRYARWDGAWILETVDTLGNVGEYSSLALDAEDVPHIGYYDRDNGDLKYATKSGASWSSTVVWSVGDAGQSASLALDGLGRPHISYEGDLGAVYYAQRVRGNWSSESVASGRGISPSLALTGDGTPSIAYFDPDTLVVKYAVRENGGWKTEFADVSGAGSVFDRGRYPSLKMDAQGNPRLAYSDATAGDSGLRYASASLHLLSPDGGELWAVGSSQTVLWKGIGPVDLEISGDGGLSYSALRQGVVDHSVTITVPDLTTDRARIRITRTSPFASSENVAFFSIAPDLVSPWWTTTVDPTVSQTNHHSLALDADGTPHVSYVDELLVALKYAYRSGAGWTTEYVDSSAYVGYHNSLALDSGGNPHISYFDDTNHDLKYAFKSDGAWTIVAVDTSDIWTMGQTSLALDDQDRPHISYGAYDELRFASRPDSVWIIQTLETEIQGLTYNTSLRLDSHGDPHIAYSGRTNLKYAVFLEWLGGWQIEIVDSTSTPEWQLSLALDAQNNPHIGYAELLSSGPVNYATRLDDVWNTETVASRNDGGRPSLVLEARKYPLLGYLKQNRLQLARYYGTVWKVENSDLEIRPGYPSLTLDALGNPRLIYSGYSGPEYASAAIEARAPEPGDLWPVGASRLVRWDGTGRVDLYLSVDGGRSWNLLQTRLTGGEYRFLVPHAPTRFARIKLERSIPHSVAVTPGLFRIEASITLYTFTVESLSRGVPGAVINWATDPGPEDIAGYRLQRMDPGVDSGWNTVIDLTRETTYIDGAGRPGSRYRLFSINGLGEELLLGEASFSLPRRLAAWPLPYRGGDLTVAFLTAGGLGGGPDHARVSIFDLQGRLVRTIAQGDYPAGSHTAVWDGRDAIGLEVPNGVYFLRATSGGEANHLKLIVMR